MRSMQHENFLYILINLKIWTKIIKHLHRPIGIKDLKLYSKLQHPDTFTINCIRHMLSCCNQKYNKTKIIVFYGTNKEHWT